MTAQAAEAEDAAPRYRGVIVIEWPAPGASPYSALTGWGVVITDATTGKQITTCAHADIVIRADAAELVTADLTLLAGEDGEPVLDDLPVLRDGEVLTGTFPFVVSEMRVRQA